MIKRLLVLFILFIGLVSYGADNVSTSLSKLEEAAFGIEYSNEKPELRLNRLEKNIYGKPKTGSVQSRISKLNKDIAGDVVGEEISPSSDSFMNEDEIVKGDGSENYPIINEIEQQLFMQSSPEKSLHSRIVKIEKKLFNKTFETDDYYSRVERIKAEYYNQNPPIANDYSDDYIAYDTSEPDLQSYYSPPQTRRLNRDPQPYSTYSSTDENELAALERKILHNTYPHESVNERLSRLENKVFNTDFFYDDEKIRLDRLSSVSKAKKSSSKYDNNKFYSKLNTAMQIGTMVLMILAFVL